MDANTIVQVLAALGVVGEALSLMPWFKANGICQAVVRVIKVLSGKDGISK